eukprot:sb/3477500/
MILLLLMFLNLLDTASPDVQLLTISSATANTLYENDEYPPEAAIDGNANTFYHSGLEPVPLQWLKLQLEEPAFVSRVVIVNRLYPATYAEVLLRLLGVFVRWYDTGC